MAKFYAQYPASSGGSNANASVGLNGDTAPSSSTEIGGVNTSGDLTPVSVDDSGNINVNVVNSSLPTGGATAANQVTGNNSLASIDGKTVHVDTGAVVVASSALPAGAATAANQATEITSLGTIVTNTTGVSTAANQTTVNSNLTGLRAQIPTTLGQTVSASSMSVVLASDQSPFAVTTSAADLTSTGSITTVNLNPNNGTATVGSVVVISPTSGQNSVTVQVTGTYTGALTPQVTIDGSNWIATSPTAITLVQTNAYLQTIPSAGPGIYSISIPPCAQFRLSANSAVTGTAVITMRASTSAKKVDLATPFPPGTQIVGALVANQTVNMAQVAGSGVLTDNGASSAGVQRVTIASNSTGQVKAAGKSQANAPVRNDYTSTNVTTSAYVQLVASMTAACSEIEIFDSSGQTLFLAVGAAASEVNQIIIFPGGNGRIPLTIASAARVSIKAISGTANAGEIDINFYV